MMSMPQNTPCVTVSAQKGKILKSLDHLILPHGDWMGQKISEEEENCGWVTVAYLHPARHTPGRGDSAARRRHVCSHTSLRPVTRRVVRQVGGWS